MKEIIAITFILLIGLMILGGCTSTTVEPSTNQQGNKEDISPELEQEKQQAENDKIPQPPALPKGK